MQFSPVNNVNNVNVANYPSSLTCTRIYIVYNRVRILGQISLMVLAHLSDSIISFGYERRCASACGATITRFMALPMQALALCMQAPGYVVFTLRMHIVLYYLCLLSWGPADRVLFLWIQLDRIHFKKSIPWEYDLDYQNEVTASVPEDVSRKPAPLLPSTLPVPLGGTVGQLLSWLPCRTASTSTVS